jgi:excisionase family DNA binding protein
MARSEELTTIEVARRLDVTAEEVYRLIFAGHLPAAPDAEGIVRISDQAVDAYLAQSSQTN